jgi:transcriptional regulator with XRE-family HTH domain
MFTNSKRLGQALRALRRRADLTQKQLGEKLGIGANWLSKIERGNAQILLTHLDGYLEHTGSSPYELLDLMLGQTRNPDEVAEQILNLLRLGTLDEDQRRGSLERIKELGYELLVTKGQTPE